MSARSTFVHATVVVVLAVSALSAQPAQKGSQAAAVLRKVDEGPRQPDFLAFRTRLRQIVAMRDVSTLLAVVHPDIKNGFGGNDGREEFRRMWTLDGGKSEVWQELAWVLDQGGTFQGPDTFAAPYVHSRWPDSFGPFDHLAVVGSNVNVRARPSLEAEIIARQSFTILRRGEDGGDSLRSWTPVVLDDGRKGFVAPGLTRSPVDYRAYFVREKGAWLMAMFVAGD